MPSDLSVDLKSPERVAIRWLHGWNPPASVRMEMLKAMRGEMNKVIGLQFARLRRGGSDRGVTWPFFKPQYTRKTDGVVVPAWGGVPRLRASIGSSISALGSFLGSEGRPRPAVVGNVKPRRRPSGRFITPASNLLQDTGRLRAERTLVRFLNPKEIGFGSTAQYAARQNKLRPFAFYEVPGDTIRMRDAAFRAFEFLMKKEPIKNV